MKALLLANIEVLAQLKAILLQLDNEAFAKESPQPASSIAKHCRHVLDHYVALQDGLERGLIDYNKRDRASDVEREVTVALARLAALQSWLGAMTLDDKPLTVMSEVSVSNTVNSLSDSSIARELSFLVSHTIHHVTFAALLAQGQDLVLGSNIGIAPSTASYLREAGTTLPADS